MGGRFSGGPTMLTTMTEEDWTIVLNQALGRSRGGFSTKIHLKTDFGGLPIAFHLTGGEASDSRNFETLLDIGPDINPRAALGDKGYDSKSNREAARQRGICPAIPYLSLIHISEPTRPY